MIKIFGQYKTINDLENFLDKYEFYWKNLNFMKI